METKKTPNNKTTQLYVRLLSYDNACILVEFINKNNENDYANITTGGVSMQLIDESLGKVHVFLESLKVQYNISHEAPHKVVEQIKEDLKK